jgi:DNA-binding MarR family transcriptional regulator
VLTIFILPILKEVLGLKEECRQAFKTFGRFRKLHISSMIPDLSHSDFATLRTIAVCEQEAKEKQEEVTVSMLTDRMCANSTAVSRSLRILEEKGYIERTVNTKDRRITYVNLKDAGRSSLQHATEILDDFAEAVFSRIDKESLHKLNDYLNQVVDIAAEEIEARKVVKGKGKEENG